MSDNPYTRLGLDSSATPAEVRTAWLLACKANHPDRGGDPTMQALINAAYTILSDPIKRQDYDEGRNPDAPDPMKGIITEHLVGVFEAVLSQTHGDIEYLDLLSQMRAVLRRGRIDLKFSMRKANTQLIRHKTLRNRLRFTGSGINPLHGHLQQCIDMAIKNLQTAAEQRKGMKLALEYLDNYAFEFKVREQAPLLRPYQQYMFTNQP